MSSYGSKYGWVFPTDATRDEVMAQLKIAIQAFGLTCEPGAGGFAMTGANGFSRRFYTDPRTDFQVVFTHSNSIQFRPLNLGDNPQDYPATQTEYDLLKRVFDQTSAIECFGFHASQDNAVVFEDSELCFFFTKSGPQLALKHLDEHRYLDPDETFLEFEGSRELYLHCNSKLHSVYFTQFAGEYYEGMHVPYNVLQDLIEKPWSDYYRPTG